MPGSAQNPIDVEAEEEHVWMPGPGEVRCVCSLMPKWLDECGCNMEAGRVFCGPEFKDWLKKACVVRRVKSRPRKCVVCARAHGSKYRFVCETRVRVRGRLVKAVSLVHKATRRAARESRIDSLAPFRTEVNAIKVEK